MKEQISTSDQGIGPDMSKLMMQAIGQEKDRAEIQREVKTPLERKKILEQHQAIEKLMNIFYEDINDQEKKNKIGEALTEVAARSGDGSSRLKAFDGLSTLVYAPGKNDKIIGEMTTVLALEENTALRDQLIYRFKDIIESDNLGDFDTVINDGQWPDEARRLAKGFKDWFYSRKALGKGQGYEKLEELHSLPQVEVFTEEEKKKIISGIDPDEIMKGSKEIEISDHDRLLNHRYISSEEKETQYLKKEEKELSVCIVYQDEKRGERKGIELDASTGTWYKDKVREARKLYPKDKAKREAFIEVASRAIVQAAWESLDDKAKESLGSPMDLKLRSKTFVEGKK